MNCNETKELLHAYLDRELDAANTLVIEKHLDSCESCCRMIESEQELQSTLRASLPYHHAPAELKNSILSRLHTEDDIQNQKAPKTKTPVLAGLAVACSIILSFSIVLYFQHQTEETQLIQDVLSGHLRTVSTNDQMGISSSSISTISAWLKSRIDFSPSIPDLKQEGLELVGAKLDYLQQRKVVSFIYNKGDKLVNLFAWPSPDVADSEREVHTKQGYKMIYWCKDYMNYWIVSDIDTNSITKIAKYLQENQAR